MIEKEFIPYDQALALKELGFDEPCFGYFNKTWSKENELLFPQYAGELENWNNTQHLCSAPLYQQAFRWFREKYNLFGCIDLHVSTPLHWFIRIDKIDINDYLYHSEDGNIQYSTYEEAELAAIVKLIEIVKKQNNE